MMRGLCIALLLSLSTGCVDLVALGAREWASPLPSVAPQSAPLRAPPSAKTTALRDSTAEIASLPPSESVVIWLEETLRLTPTGAALQVRRVIYVRTEGGLAAADVVVDMGSDGQLGLVEGKTRKPGGRIVDLGRNEVIEDEVLLRPGDPTTHRAVFAMPEVAVGDTIDYTYEIVYPKPKLFWTFSVPDEVPVLQFGFALYAPPNFHFRSRVSGAIVPAQGPYWAGSVLAFGGGHLIPSDPEPLAPPAASLPPTFSVVLTSADEGGETVPVIRGWKDMFISVLEQQREEIGAVSSVPIAMPASGIERLRALYDWSRDEIADAPDIGGDKLRTARRIAQDRRATDRERALFLKGALTRYGVTAHLAFVRDRREGRLDAKTVEPRAVSAMLLYLPNAFRGSPSDEGDAARGLFVDPSCRVCALGDLPWYYQDTSALVATEGPKQKIVIKMLHTPVDARLASSRRVSATLTLAETGDADVALAVSLSGVAGGAFRSAARSGVRGRTALRAAVEALVEDLCPRASLLEFSATGLADPDVPVEIRVKLHVSALAVRSGDRLILPLSPFSRLGLDPLAGEARRDDIEVPYGWTIQETTDVVLPEGYDLTDAPGAMLAEALGGRVESTAPVIDGSHLHHTLRVELPRLSLPAERANELRPLYSSYLGASNAMAILARRAKAPVGKPRQVQGPARK